MWSKARFYLPYYIYLLIFLSQLIKNKSGFLATDPSNRCNYWVSGWTLLFLKVGTKWAFGHFFINFSRPNAKIKEFVNVKVTITHFFSNGKWPQISFIQTVLSTLVDSSSVYLTFLKFRTYAYPLSQLYTINV